MDSFVLTVREQPSTLSTATTTTTFTTRTTTTTSGAMISKGMLNYNFFILFYFIFFCSKKILD